MGRRKDGRGLALVRPKKRRGQWAKLSKRINGIWDKAVVLIENGGSDGVRGSVGRIASDEFLVFTMFMMLDDRG
jgi:hypothetical protein